ncbi:pilus assembly protein TadG-related protein [Aestuariicoccus sp. MJ-SS9]|uniref:pilus assembly protein TadG-related protein n=1 Tax=Aestuariicoccus sp. MJ-SS9 TaxID=3079855 RepID=UPI00290BBDF8|nr:pilus assembly protein TadG-related protein [Aestuariicoccus sp. MJ-SS9]MDU8913269.1 pilus assembly protein TadG-related protein [Aestuariicoccus sp. MJ-SS9]
MSKFMRSEEGFVLTFALIILPIFIGFGLLIIDAGRGNNAHADLAAAADSLALAGARELDGGVNAIPRAKAAMSNLTNTVSMLAKEGDDVEIELVYEDVAGNEFQVAFLEDIPEFDTTPIDSAWLAANSTNFSPDANYIYVRAQSQNLETVFLNPVNLLPSSVPIVATAVAKSTSAACDVPPIYMCNPFEEDTDIDGDQLQVEFALGNLHGRMIRLHPPGGLTQSPGNFGFLSMPGNPGADAINDLFAGATNYSCYSNETVTTKPGASDAIRQGINTRFDIYWGQYSGGGPPGSFQPVPAKNVRKGAAPAINGPNFNDCVAQGGNEASPGGGPGAVIGDDHVMDLETGLFNSNTNISNAYGLPDNSSMSSIAGSDLGYSLGADHNWDINEYFSRNYGVNTSNPPDTSDEPHPQNVTSSFTGLTPSRYDVYLAEIANDWHLSRAPGDPSTPADDGETGEPQCGAPASTDPDAEDPRVFAIAIIDCNSQSVEGGGSNTYVVNSYASVFLTRPMFRYSPATDSTIDIEIIDITGYGGNGTLETFVREEAILVR